MKGQFFITFMIGMSCIAVCSVLLWQYIRRQNNKAGTLFGVTAVSMVAIGELWLYGADYITISTSSWFSPLFYGAMASLSWLFMFLLAFPVLLAGAVGCFIYRLFHTDGHPCKASNCVSKGMSRRTFLKGMAAAIPVLALGTSTIGIFDGEQHLATTVHKLRYPNLPNSLAGYRIGQISDSHMGLFFSPQRLQEAIEVLVKEKVDRVVLTGDLIDELTLLPQCQTILRDACRKFPDGIDFCYGNHEYYRGIERITDMLKKTGVRILRNSNYKAAENFYIAGTDYSFAQGEENFARQREEYVQKSLQGIPENSFVVMLAHHSAFIDEGFRHHVNLTLCGHTHGAQFAPIGPLVQMIAFKYLRGLFQSGDACYGYVNRGTGHWLPLRIACSREVSIFELNR